MVSLKVSGMKCGGCVSAVEQTLLGLPGTGEVSVDLEQGLACYSGSADTDVVCKALADAGYPAQVSIQ